MPRDIFERMEVKDKSEDDVAAIAQKKCTIDLQRLSLMKDGNKYLLLRLSGFQNAFNHFLVILISVRFVRGRNWWKTEDKTYRIPSMVISDQNASFFPRYFFVLSVCKFYRIS